MDIEGVLTIWHLPTNSPAFGMPVIVPHRLRSRLLSFATESVILKSVYDSDSVASCLSLLKQEDVGDRMSRGDKLLFSFMHFFPSFCACLELLEFFISFS